MCLHFFTKDKPHHQPYTYLCPSSSIGKYIKRNGGNDSGSYINVECKYKKSFLQIYKPNKTHVYKKRLNYNFIN